MSTVERAFGGPEIEVVAKATRRRFTVEYKRKIVREADGCKARGRWGRCCAARDCTRPTWRRGGQCASAATWWGVQVKNPVGRTFPTLRWPRVRGLAERFESQLLLDIGALLTRLYRRVGCSWRGGPAARGRQC